MSAASAHALGELHIAYERLWRLCELAEIPTFDAVQYDVELRIAQFVWDDSAFGLVILLDDYDLASMTPRRLRALWDEELRQAAEEEVRADEAMLN